MINIKHGLKFPSRDRGPSSLRSSLTIRGNEDAHFGNPCISRTTCTSNPHWSTHSTSSGTSTFCTCIGGWVLKLEFLWNGLDAYSLLASWLVISQLSFLACSDNRSIRSSHCIFGHWQNIHSTISDIRF